MVNVHLLCLLDIDEKLLGMGSDLGAGPRANVLLDFLPVFAKQLKTYANVSSVSYML